MKTMFWVNICSVMFPRKVAQYLTDQLVALPLSYIYLKIFFIVFTSQWKQNNAKGEVPLLMLKPMIPELSIILLSLRYNTAFILLVKRLMLSTAHLDVFYLLSLGWFMNLIQTTRLRNIYGLPAHQLDANFSFQKLELEHVASF